MKPELYIVRHGETGLNAENKFRGFIDVKLNHNGRAEARELGKFFSAKEVGSVHASDLSRSGDTAAEIADKHNLSVADSSDLRPWDVGDLAGKSKVANASVIDEHVEKPDMKLPGGESLNEFRTRFGSKLRQIMRTAAKPAVVVVHASNAHEVGNMVEGDPDAGDIKPGGVIAIYPTESVSMKVLRGAQEKAEGWRTS